MTSARTPAGHHAVPSRDERTGHRPLRRRLDPRARARQIAAVTAVVTALAAQGADEVEESQELVSGWNDRSHAVRAPLHAAPGAWRSFAG
ncbi:acyl-CoA carboxylase subunit epsilon [Rathayibacter sp. VKM Ac-2630]|uniref:acyl-CoA carboxylase subunit epsilon n=1 Tax=Rathayibacter sp. VKM Ac-2630 TaxID=1938617 RepID=UPI000980EB54|nr:acyl-CoA carboxylase subunit epsilon [Rathayibacter sp. VKM Ac-2630]OOB91730.1 hypothetical protein B0T42_04615 [Rathayibacter sp. VKM Ac-2630]